MRRLFTLLIVATLSVCAGCTQQTTSTSVEIIKGVSFSPFALNGPGITDFFTTAKQVVTLISWQGDWAQLSDQVAAPYLVLRSAATNNIEPVVVVHAMHNEEGIFIRPLDDATKQSYLSSISQLATDYTPKYIGIGIEVNVFAEKASTQDFDAFVQLFDQAYDKIKAVSPRTQIFVTFQLEHLKGLRGGLFGGQNDSTQTQWSILDRFSKADFFAFTAYPVIIYNSPADIPDDYFRDITNHTVKPFAISETGWFREAPQGWDSSSEDEQAAYIERMYQLMTVQKPIFIVWSFLYDPPVDQPVFKTLGLLSAQNASSPAWDKWQSVK